MTSWPERMLHRIATVTLLAVLFGLAARLHLRSAQTRDTLAERGSQVRALDEMRRACALGKRPSAIELAAVASLFPGETIACREIDGALFLTFVTASSDQLAMSHR